MTVKHITPATSPGDNKMYHFDVDIASYADAGPTHTLELVDVSTGAERDGLLARLDPDPRLGDLNKNGPG